MSTGARRQERQAWGDPSGMHNRDGEPQDPEFPAIGSLSKSTADVETLLNQNHLTCLHDVPSSEAHNVDTTC